MWQSSQSGNPSNQASARKKRGRGIHVKRVTAQVKIQEKLKLGEAPKKEKLYAVRLFLNDFGPKGVFINALESMTVGQEIAITIEQPKRFYCRGRVCSCQYLDTKIISHETYRYRMGIEFIFTSEQEERSVREYYELVMREHVNVVAVAA